MMKKSLLLILVVAVLTLCGCQGSNEIGKIDVEAAQQVALNALGIDGAEIHAVSVILCEQDGISYYDVDITVDGGAYEVAVDAVTGVIIEQSQGIAENTDVAVTEDTTAENTDVAVTEDTTAEPAQTEPSENGISAEEAVEIAVRHAGFTRAHVRVATCKLDTGELVSDLPSHTWAKYTVTFYDASVNHYYYIVDAQSGEVLYHFTYSRSTSSSQGIQPREEDEIDPEMNVNPSFVAEHEDLIDAARELITSAQKAVDGRDVKLTTEEAIKIGLAQIPGASTSDVTQIVGNQYVYFVTVVFQNMKYEFAIDAYSGSFRTWNAEPIG